MRVILVILSSEMSAVIVPRPESPISIRLLHTSDAGDGNSPRDSA